jgi:hypothetical protein
VQYDHTVPTKERLHGIKVTTYHVQPSGVDAISIGPEAGLLVVDSESRQI